MKNKTPFAIILFLHAGFAPKDIISMGYKRTTVYRYTGFYKEAKEEFKQKTKGAS